MVHRKISPLWQNLVVVKKLRPNPHPPRVPHVDDFLKEGEFRNTLEGKILRPPSTRLL